MQNIRFLKIEEIIQMHIDQIRLFGGSHGIRDHKLLESAVYEPQASFAGAYLHKDVYHMAAAYAQGIIKNHPFIDGNKRTGIVSAFVFLQYNNCELDFDQDEFFALAIDIATSKIIYAKIAAYFKRKCINH